MANDTTLVSREADSLRLTPVERLITHYTNIQAEMHFALQLEPGVSADVFRIVAPEIREKIRQLRTDLENSDSKNEGFLLRLIDRLEKRFDSYLVNPTDP